MSRPPPSPPGTVEAVGKRLVEVAEQRQQTLPDGVVAADVAREEVVGIDLGDADVAGVVADEAELVVVVGKVGAVAAAEALLHADRQPLLAQRPHEVVVVAREAELVLDADVHVDALGRDVGRARGGDPRRRVLGEEVGAVGVIVERPVALAEIARPGDTVEADVLERLAERGLVDAVVVRVDERLRVVHDDPVADVVDPVTVQVDELTVADELTRDAAGKGRRRPARREQDVDRLGRRLAGLADAVRIRVAAVEKAARVAEERKVVELIVAPTRRRLRVGRQVETRRVGVVEERIAERDHQVLQLADARVAIRVRRHVIEGEVLADVARQRRLRLHLEAVGHAVVQELLEIDGPAEGADRGEQVAMLGTEVQAPRSRPSRRRRWRDTCGSPRAAARDRRFRRRCRCLRHHRHRYTRRARRARVPNLFR